MKKINLGVVGATGQVGRTVLRILEERDFPIENLRLFASSKSEGKELSCGEIS
ncbi:MAG: aspartate-semialdehyde dehydrogenase, partial [Candidatus Ancillula sp.]|nr:aspartate-semialdehyde dehydrogenase [Candidatus Ancillula sp.]